MKDFFKLIHITKHPLTSLAALFILGIAGYSIYKKGNVGMEDITLIGMALALLPARDPNKPNLGSGAAMLAVFCMLACGCVTNKKCLDKYGSSTNTIMLHDTVNITVEAPVPADSVRGEISEDSLKMLLDGTIEEITKVSDSKNLEVKFWKDKYTHALKFSADKKKDTVVVFKEVPITVQGDCPPVVVASPPALSWYVKLWKGFQFFSAFLVLGGLCLVILLLVFKRF